MDIKLVDLYKTAADKLADPTIDLVFEHSLLDRLLLIYDECKKQLATSKDFNIEILLQTVKIVKSFVELHHEKLEEEYIFPHFKNEHQDLVKTLILQHKSSQVLTSTIIKLCDKKLLESLYNRSKLMAMLCTFIKMYRVHASRENTVLFPAFKELMSESELESLADKFEEIEIKKFGPKGDRSIIPIIEKLEKALFINDINKFNP